MPFLITLGTGTLLMIMFMTGLAVLDRWCVSAAKLVYRLATHRATRHWLATAWRAFARVTCIGLLYASPVSLWLVAGPFFGIVASAAIALMVLRVAMIKKPGGITAKPPSIPEDPDFKDAYRAMDYWRESYLDGHLTTDQFLHLHELIDPVLLKVIKKNWGTWSRPDGWYHMAISNVTSGLSLVDVVNNRMRQDQSLSAAWKSLLVDEMASEVQLVEQGMKSAALGKGMQTQPVDKFALPELPTTDAALLRWAASNLTSAKPGDLLGGHILQDICAALKRAGCSENHLPVRLRRAAVATFFDMRLLGLLAKEVLKRNEEHLQLADEGWLRWGAVYLPLVHDEDVDAFGSSPHRVLEALRRAGYSLDSLDGKPVTTGSVRYLGALAQCALAGDCVS